MRRSLEVIDRMEFGVSLRTKSLRMLRDLDILASIQRKTRCVVEVMLTTADEALAARLEPAESTVGERLELLRALRDAGIPTVVTLGPVLPYLTDSLENLEALLGDCVEARVYGVIQNGFGVTLRAGSSAYFFSCLRELDPESREKQACFCRRTRRHLPTFFKRARRPAGWSPIRRPCLPIATRFLTGGRGNSCLSLISLRFEAA